ncbi:hypothetical protein K474DRAFT_1597320 [Panus rudis PR-1116 ss-1]|nr:hypothetical protein K474DRAFT_1597320 [Panus rudis PR-1116 ss-1]
METKSPKAPIKQAAANGGTIGDKIGNGLSNGSTEFEVPGDIGEVRVSKLLIHPVKSCRGISVQEVKYTPEGLENDRKWCIVDAEKHTVITAREVSKLVLIQTRLDVDPSDPHGGRLVITVPMKNGPVVLSVPINPTPDVLKSWPIVSDCTMFGIFTVDGYIVQPLSSSERSPSDVFSEYVGKNALFLMKGPAARECPPTYAFPDLKAHSVFQDAYPLLVASEESLEALSDRIKQAAQIGDDQPGKIGGLNREIWKDGNIKMERFRPNIVFKGAGVPFAEDTWRRVVIVPEDVDPATAGDDRMFTLIAKCTRCLLPNVDTETGVRDAAVPFKILMKFRVGLDPTQKNKACFGCNGVSGGSGTVRVGDRVYVKEWAGEAGV